MSKQLTLVSLTVALLFGFAAPSTAASLAELSDAQRLELGIFSLRAIGLKKMADELQVIPDAEKALQLETITKALTTALILKELPCGTMVDVIALEEQGQYELTCTVLSGGKTKIKYRLDASTGQILELNHFGR